MNYKGFLLATAGGLAMAPGAHAADMQVKAPVMVPPPPSWTGWYVGVHAGAAWQNMNAINVGSCRPTNHSDGSASSAVARSATTCSMAMQFSVSKETFPALRVDRAGQSLPPTQRAFRPRPTG